MTSKEWKILKELKDIYPQLKITMFTIPEQCSKEWLQTANAIKWIRMAVHGTDHKYKKSQIPNGKLEYFNDWYKAPKWKLTKEEFDKLHELGYKVATNKTNPFKGEYVYDDGKEIIKDIHYQLPNGLYTWHGHVQSQAPVNKDSPNGIGDVLDKFKKHIPLNAEFVWLE